MPLWFAPVIAFFFGLGGAVTTGGAVVLAGVRGGQLLSAVRAGQLANQAAQQAARHSNALRAAQQATTLANRDPKEPCEDCDPDCFTKPEGADEAEFMRQLKDQQDAINNLTANQIVSARDAIRTAGGTGPLRDAAAQQAARKAYQAKRMLELTETMSEARAEQLVAQELQGLAATHRLDIIAGGNPSDISGVGDGRINSSMGSQWRYGRAQQLETKARNMQSKGQGDQKMNVKLKKCEKNEII
jgi:hypothetical protein